MQSQWETESGQEPESHLHPHLQAHLRALSLGAISLPEPQGRCLRPNAVASLLSVCSGRCLLAAPTRPPTSCHPVQTPHLLALGQDSSASKGGQKASWQDILLSLRPRLHLGCPERTVTLFWIKDSPFSGLGCTSMGPQDQTNLVVNLRKVDIQGTVSQ